MKIIGKIKVDKLPGRCIDCPFWGLTLGENYCMLKPKLKLLYFKRHKNCILTLATEKEKV